VTIFINEYDHTTHGSVEFKYLSLWITKVSCWVVLVKDDKKWKDKIKQLDQDIFGNDDEGKKIIAIKKWKEYIEKRIKQVQAQK
jgi:hypothetical protein